MPTRRPGSDPRLLTTRQAADRAGVPVHMVKRWNELGLITNHGGGGKGSVALYDWAEVRTAPDRRQNLRLGWRGRALTNAERLANSRLDRGIIPTVPLSLPYRALAWTCQKCGDLLSPTSIRRSDPRTMQWHKCDREYVRNRTREDEEFRLRIRAQSLVAYHRKQDASADAATRRGYDWTGPELEVAARADLTAPQVAALLGRTLSGVMYVRKGLRRDPRKIRMAGVPRAD